MFLRIENPVKSIPSIELLRTIGASSARGHDEKIGQFGSGAANMLAVFAREGYLDKCKFCFGRDVYTFGVESKPVTTSNGDSFTIEEIVMKKQNGGKTNLNISTKFGELDWPDLIMGVRELVSNAIDGAIEYSGAASDAAFTMVADNECRAKDGYVRIYIPADDHRIRQYVNELEVNFLCLTRAYDPTQRIIPNRYNGKSRFYRKGVFVGEFGSHNQPGLFCYNIANLNLKESRIVDSSEARDKAATAILFADQQTVETFIRSFDNRIDYYEHSLPSWEFTLSNYYDVSKEDKDKVISTWKAAYKQIFGDAVLCENDHMFELMTGHQQACHKVSATLFAILNQFRDGDIVKDVADVLSKDEREGRTILPATDDAIASLNQVWAMLVSFNLTDGKSIPSIHCYTEHMSPSGKQIMGFYRDGAVYIHTDFASRSLALTQTMIEEVAHYVTDAMDYTRGFQDFAFRLIAAVIH